MTRIAFGIDLIRMGILRSRGVYLNYPEDDNLEHVLLEGALQNGIAPENVDVIVVTDGGAILGIGDQGVGGVAISVSHSCAQCHHHYVVK